METAFFIVLGALLAVGVIVWLVCSFMSAEADKSRKFCSDMMAQAFAARREANEHAPESQIVAAMTTQHRGQTMLLDKFGEQLMGFTSEGRDWLSRQGELATLQTNLERERVRAERAERAMLDATMTPEDNPIATETQTANGMVTSTSRFTDQV